MMCFLVRKLHKADKSIAIYKADRYNIFIKKNILKCTHSIDIYYR